MSTDVFTRQVQDFTRQAQDMFNNGKDAKIPENIQAFAEDSVSKSREMYTKFSAAAADNAKAFEEIVLTAQAGAKSIGEKMLANTTANAEAAFDAAQAIARAKTFPEIARLQASYMQQQINVAGTQMKELFELSTKVAKQTSETLSTTATKSFEQMKKAG